MNSKKESGVNLFDTIKKKATKNHQQHNPRSHRFYRDKQPKDFNKKPLENLNLREVLRDMINKN